MAVIPKTASYVIFADFVLTSPNIETYKYFKDYKIQDFMTESGICIAIKYFLGNEFKLLIRKLTSSIDVTCGSYFSSFLDIIPLTIPLCISVPGSFMQQCYILDVAIRPVNTPVRIGYQTRNSYDAVF